MRDLGTAAVAIFCNGGKSINGQRHHALNNNNNNNNNNNTLFP